MRMKSQQRGYSNINFVSVMLYVLSLAGLYAAWKYAPIYWDRETMKDITANAILSAYKVGEDKIRDVIIERAAREVKLEIRYDDIKIERDGSRFNVDVYYTVRVDHLFYGPTFHKIHIAVERTVLG